MSEKKREKRFLTIDIIGDMTRDIYTIETKYNSDMEILEKKIVKQDGKEYIIVPGDPKRD